jgi:TolB-like protein/Tfp pilus assembly protein PilF
MTPERWQQIQELLHAALALPVEDRVRFLAGACAGDDALRREVESLLAQASGAVGFLSTPAAAYAGDLLSDGASMIGRQLGPYAIQARLGAGGMGEVYLAEDTRLHRLVALKALRDAGAATPEGRERLLREARAVAALNHPHIAAIYDILDSTGNAGTPPHIVMEYVAGETLSERLKQGPVPVGDALRFGKEVADALAAAHTQGIIHRDLKPANLRLTSNGHVKVLDFGLARMVAPTSDTTGLPIERVLQTRLDHQIAGTPGYMSPEQALGRGIDTPTDVFSLGVVLFEMFAGDRPFPSDDFLSTALAMMTRPTPRLIDVMPDVAPAIDALVTRMLAKEPRERPSAREVVAEIEQLSRLGSPDTAPPAVRRRLEWLAYAAGAAAVVLALAGTVEFFRARAPLTHATDIAVLPLANLSADAGQEYLADGMTDAIIIELGRVRSLRVISRQSVMRYKEGTTAMPQIARELGVNAIVTGSVMRLDDKIRVTIALVQPSPERQLWSGAYDGGIGDMLTLSSLVAQDTLQHAGATVTPEERTQLSRTRPLNIHAQEAYLTGRFFWNKRTKPDIERAIQEFQRAIALDPKAAVAYAGLADCYVVVWDEGYAPRDQAYREAKANAVRALELDDTLAEAHASLGAIYSLNVLWAPAEQEYRRALELNPGYATAHQWYSVNLSTLGRHREAVEEAKRALALDPASPVQNLFLGRQLYLAGDYPAAAVQIRKALELDPKFGHSLLGRTYLQQKNVPAAIQEFEEEARLSGGDNGDLGYTYAAAGNVAAAEREVNRLITASRRRYIAPYEIALVYSALGDHDRALEWFGKAYHESEGVVVDLAVDPRLARLSTDPRFVAMLQKSGLTYTGAH